MDDDGEATAVRVEKGSPGLVIEAPINDDGDGSRRRSREGRGRKDGRVSGMAAGVVAAAADGGAGEDGPVGWPLHQAQATEVEGGERSKGQRLRANRPCGSLSPIPSQQQILNTCCKNKKIYAPKRSLGIGIPPFFPQKNRSHLLPH